MQKKTFNLVAIVLIIIFCVVISPITMQNDTYYTISIGEHILENGIDMQDPFSWHEDLPYTYPHWLYDVFIYLIYAAGQAVAGLTGGYTAIYISTCVLASILGLTIYKVNTKIAKNQVVSFIITIATMYILKGYIAARAQLVTFILFVLEIYFIEKLLETRKKRYIFGLILIPTIIANIHVAVWYFYFILYLPYIAEYLISLISKYKNGESKESYKIITTRNDNTKILIIVMLISLLTGFLNPLGTTTYTYLVKTMQGTTTQNINEHLPMTLMEHLPVIIELVVLFGLIIFSKGKLKLKDIFMIGGLMVLMFYSRRQLTMFTLVVGIILNEFFVRTFKAYNEKSIDRLEEDGSSLLGVSILTVLIAILSISLIVEKADDKYVHEGAYPVRMAKYILENLDVDNIKLYNEYNFGSYLLYKGIPVFIDSRADLYAPEFNTKTGNPEDGRDIFMDALESARGDLWYEDVFEDYGITHVLLYKTSRINYIMKNVNSEKYRILNQDSNFILYEIVDSNQAQ